MKQAIQSLIKVEFGIRKIVHYQKFEERPFWIKNTWNLSPERIYRPPKNKFKGYTFFLRNKLDIFKNFAVK